MDYSAMKIAQYIIDYCNKHDISISNLKLQKLLYYAWIHFYKVTGRRLFKDDICAWQLGPVVPEVYSEYCAFGGKSINREYGVKLDSYDEATLQDFISEHGHMPASRFVDKSHEPGGAWDNVYDGGNGNRAVIPFDLIMSLECNK